MIYAALPDGTRVAADPSLRRADAACPACASPLIAHCGSLVAWHWAHRSSDCDPWSEPESAWHLAWKQAAETDRRAHVEVVRTVDGETHRADIVLPGGLIIELQHGYLSVEDIAAREQFWGRRLVWLYDADRFRDRIHWGSRGGFWWRNGARSMATHQREVWWHIDNELLLVELRVVTVQAGDGAQKRILGRIRARETVDSKYPSLRRPAFDDRPGA